MEQLTEKVGAVLDRRLLAGGASPGPVIEVEGLNVTYGDFPAVKDLSFQVQPGELYALLGTNGAGKTSALEVIEGHRPASSGRVRVFGQSPTDRAATRPRMGIMLQESGFSADLTVAESLRLIGRLSGRSDRVDRVLGVVDLTRKADTRVAQLSGGERRRLDFATALYGRPELIILDEPTTGLDIQSRDALWEDPAAGLAHKAADGFRRVAQSRILECQAHAHAFTGRPRPVRRTRRQPGRPIRQSGTPACWAQCGSRPARWPSSSGEAGPPAPA